MEPGRSGNLGSNNIGMAAAKLIRTPPKVAGVYSNGVLYGRRLMSPTGDIFLRAQHRYWHQTNPAGLQR